MSNSRPPEHIGSILEHLKKNKPFQSIVEVELGYGKHKQKMWAVNNILVRSNNQGQPILPQSLEKRLENLATDLQLEKTDSINTQSKKNKHRTLLIQATRNYDPQLVNLLLDHGADPSLVDDENNNALMHAAQLGYTDILKEFMKLIHSQDKTAPEKDKSSAKKNELPVKNQDQKAAPTKTPESSVQNASEHKPAKRDVEKSSLRIKLEHSILLQKNNEGKTTEDLIREYIENLPPPENKEDKEQKKDAKKKEKLEQDKLQGKQPVDRLKALLNDLHTRKMERSQPADSNREAAASSLEQVKLEKPSVASETATALALESAYQAKLEKAQRSYQRFCLNKFSLFKTEERERAVRYKPLVKATLDRERQRKHYDLILLSLAANEELPSLKTLQKISSDHSHNPILIKRKIKPTPYEEEDQFSLYGCYPSDWSLNTFSKWHTPFLANDNQLIGAFENLQKDKYRLLENPSENLKKMVSIFHKPTLNTEKRINLHLAIQDGKTKLPVSYEDLALIRTGLSLIKDYYAPESAPLPHFLECGTLRRLLTFHLGRRYCQDAQELYQELCRTEVRHIDDFMEIYKTIEAELERVKQLDHDEKNLNNPLNSSYTRRLNYILTTWKKTDAYQQNKHPKDVHTYMDIFDIKFEPAQIERKAHSKRLW